MPETAVVAGLGPGFCERLAERLASDGYDVAVFGRSEEYLEEFAADLRAAGHDALAVPTDVTDSEQVADGFERVREALGPVEVLAHTASTATSPGGEELDPDRFEEMWRLYAYGGLLCFREALDDLRAEGGTALFFGAAPEAGDFAFKSGKDATRGLARSLADAYGPEGVHVAHVVVAGSIRNPDVYEGPGEVTEAEHMDPDAVAETCAHLVGQDRSAWTFELDLRPHVQGLY
ncbi:MAG: SDR family NAD(P)-dependent oxidoreductase [Halobacteriaceae archaeon]